MLDDLSLQGMSRPSASYIDLAEDNLSAEPSDVVNGQTSPNETASTQPVAVSNPMPTPAFAAPQTVAREHMDNATTLLYFGAFLLVAAAGLFVAFGGASGGIRTFIVALLATAMYSGGFWLWYQKPTLKQAALAFIGIGIVLVPLVGVAAYSYLFHDAAKAVWLVTSVACLAVYGHALLVLKNSLLEYLLLGTFVSLFESAVAILSAPAYCFGWGLAAVGLLIQMMQIVRHQKPNYTEPKTITSSVLLPASMFIALVMIPGHGVVQLAVSMLLAAFYYGLQGWQSDDNARESSFIGAQVLFLAANALFMYDLGGSLTYAAVALLLWAFPQLVWVWMQANRYAVHGAIILVSSLSLATLLASQSPGVMCIAAAATTVAGAIVWLRHGLVGTYAVAIGALLVAAYTLFSRVVYHEYYAQFTLAAFLGIVAAQVGIFVLLRQKKHDTNTWRAGFQVMLLVTVLITIIMALLESPTTVAVTLWALVALVAPLILFENWLLWSSVSGLFTLVPILAAYSKPGIFLASTVVAVVWNGIVSWWLTSEHNRAFSVVAWLIVPLATAHALPSIDIDGYYAVAFLVVAFALLGLRSIALLRPRKIIHAASTDGDAYTVGYVLASMIAVLASATGPRFLPLIVCVTVGIIAYVASVYVEKRSMLMAPLPILAQIGLWMTYDGSQMVSYLVLSSVIAVLGYGYYAVTERPEPGSRGYYIQLMSLFALFVPTAAYLSGNVWWPMPWAFLLATLATVHYVWQREQSQREMAGGLVLLAVWTVMNFYGVANAQAYAHVAAMFSAVYAYWRAKRGEMSASDQYIVVTLGVVTIPLIIQALTGAKGDVYGWWLLLEQVVIMLLGMWLRKKIMVRWGLYVALGSVLYQLRNLGWAALGLVAVFLIGLGIYYLQKSGKTDEK